METNPSSKNNAPDDDEVQRVEVHRVGEPTAKQARRFRIRMALTGAVGILAAAAIVFLLISAVVFLLPVLIGAAGAFLLIAWIRQWLARR